MVVTRKIARNINEEIVEPDASSNESDDQEQSTFDEDSDNEGESSNLKKPSSKFSKSTKTLEDDLIEEAGGSSTSYKKTTRPSKSTSKKASSRDLKSSRFTTNEPKSSSTCKRLIWLSIMIAIIGVCAACSRLEILKKMCESLVSSKPSYQEVIKKYKLSSALPGISGKIAEIAIEKFEIEKKKAQHEYYLAEPVVLMLYGQNETKLREFYLDLASTLMEFEKKDQNIIFDIRDIKHQVDTIKNSLSETKLVLFDGLQRLDGRDYLQIYGFVDGNDSYVKPSLIVFSVHGKVNNSSHIFDDVESMERFVRQDLRHRWNNIDVNNLEAFLNRIVSFVSFVV